MSSEQRRERAQESRNPSKSAHGIWELTRGFRLRYSLAIAVLMLGSSAAYLVPLVSKAAIDSVLGGANSGSAELVTEGGVVANFAISLLLGLQGTPALVLAASWIVLFTAFAGVLQFFRGRWAAEASEGIVRRLRGELYGHLERLPASYLDRAETGDLVQRCSSDVETLRTFLQSQIVEMLRALFLFGAAVPLMLSLHVELTLVAIALFPVIFLYAYIFFERTKTLFQRADEAEGEMTSVMQENLTCNRVVRAFAQQDYEIERFAERNTTHRLAVEKHIHLLGWYWSTSDLIAIGQTGLVLFYGAYLVQDGAITIGTLVAFMGFQMLAIWPVRQLGRVLSMVGKASVALTRLNEILGERLEDEEDRPEPDPERLTGRIRFESISHRFHAETHALHDFDLEIEPGETIAFIGPPGSGKSTIIQLLLRLYEPSQGRILLDRRPLTSYSRHFVRSQIAVALQEPFLFSRTIEFNVQLAREGATRGDLVQATSAAAIHDSIESFEGGYETLLGERGVNLSGGQRQRVALARALLKNAPILVLDDALSAVDTKTESQILDALERRKGQRTTLLIAHRLSTVLLADRVAVLEHGKLVQLGSHRVLRQQEGPYARLWSLQGDGQQSESGATRDE
jgi:ATP-binding cassette subfamily B protein